MAKVSMKEKKGLLGESLAEIITILKAAKVDKEVIQNVKSKVDEAEAIFTAAPTSVKVNENGEVFCSYFGVYMAEDQFHKSGKGKLDSMCIEGKKLARAQKSLVNKATNEVLRQFRSKEITAEEMDELLSVIETNAKHKFAQGTVVVPSGYPFTLEDEPETEAGE